MPSSSINISRSLKFFEVSAVFDPFFESFEENFSLNYTVLIEICDVLLSKLYDIYETEFSKAYKEGKKDTLIALKEEKHEHMGIDKEIEYFLAASHGFSTLKRTESDTEKMIPYADVMLDYIFEKKDGYVEKKGEIISISLLPTEEGKEVEMTRLASLKLAEDQCLFPSREALFTKKLTRRKKEYQAALLMLSPDIEDRREANKIIVNLNEEKKKEDALLLQQIRANQYIQKERKIDVHSMVMNKFLTQAEAEANFDYRMLETLSCFVEIGGPKSRLIKEIFNIAREEIRKENNSIKCLAVSENTTYCIIKERRTAKGLAALGRLSHDILCDLIICHMAKSDFIEKLRSGCITFGDLALLRPLQLKECIEKEISPYYISWRMALEEGTTDLQDKIEAHHQNTLHQIVTSLLEEALRDNHPGLYDVFLEQKSDFKRYIENNFHLHHAAKNGSYKITKFLLKKNSNVDITDHKGRTPLHYAAKKGHFNIAKLLLNNKAFIDARDGNSSTPLHHAVRGGIFKMVELLVSKGARINIEDASRWTPFFYAVLRGDTDIIKLLLVKRARINGTNIYRDTPFCIAVMNGHIEIMKLLYNQGASITIPHQCGDTPLLWAAENADIEILEFLLSKLNKKNINVRGAYGNTPLHLAVAQNRLDAVMLLVDRNADLSMTNISGETPLHLAAVRGHVGMFEFLLKKSPYIDVADRKSPTLLYAALQSESKEMINMVLGKGGVLSWKETLLCPNFSTKNYLSPSLQRVKEHVSNNIFSSYSVKHLHEKEETSSHAKQEERRRSAIQQQGTATSCC